MGAVKTLFLSYHPCGTSLGVVEQVTISAMAMSVIKRSERNILRSGTPAIVAHEHRLTLELSKCVLPPHTVESEVSRVTSEGNDVPQNVFMPFTRTWKYQRSQTGHDVELKFLYILFSSFNIAQPISFTLSYLLLPTNLPMNSFGSFPPSSNASAYAFAPSSFPSSTVQFSHFCIKTF